MICCDTCPYYPTCEEIEDFNRDVLGLGESWGEEYAELDVAGGQPVRGPGAAPGLLWRSVKLVPGLLRHPRSRARREEERQAKSHD